MASFFGLALPDIPFVNAMPTGVALDPANAALLMEAARLSAMKPTTISTTKESAFIVDAETTEKLAIMFYPESISEDHVANFGVAQVIGLSHPKYEWVNSEHMVSLPIGFHAEANDYSDILEKVNWLESLTYPEYGGDNLVNGPHELLLIFGEMFKQRKYKLANLRIEWGNVYHPMTKIPLSCTAVLTLKEVADKAVDFKTIRG